MKIQIKNYTFDASAKQVTLNDYTSIDLDNVLLITNVTDNVIIYNFAVPTKGATVSGNILTLTYDTTTMSDTDKLQIWFNDTDMSFVTDESVILLRRVVKLLESNAVVDANMRQRMTVDVMPAVALSTVANMIGGAVGNNPPTGSINQSYLPVWSGPVDPRWTNIELARTSYNTGIRTNLIFS